MNKIKTLEERIESIRDNIKSLETADISDRKQILNNIAVKRWLIKQDFPDAKQSAT